MSTSSHFLNKAPKSTAFSGLHAWIKTLVLILAVVASLGGMKPIIASAAGTTYYVDKTNGSCSDTANPGTSSALPFCTITKGATVARFGDTVRVIAGSYTEKVTPNYSGTPGNPITYSAVSGVSVNGGATTTDAFHLSGVSYITIDGFTINAPTQYGIYMTTGSNLIVSGNQITGTTSHGIYVDTTNNVTISNNQVSTSGGEGIYLKATYASTISGNTTDHNNSDGIRLTTCYTVSVMNNTSFANNPYGIDVISTSYSNTLLHNIAYANVNSGIEFESSSHDNTVAGNLSYNNGDHGIEVDAATNQTIVGNTFQGNYNSGINLEVSSGGATIQNNILVDNGLAPVSGKPYNIYVDSTSVALTTLNYNLYYLTAPYVQQIYWNTTGYNSLASFKAINTTQELNGLEGNPLFVAPAAPAAKPPLVVTGNYNISAGSPAIDSANSDAPGETTLDIVGNPRVDDPGTSNTGAGTRAYDDRGAYEFQPSIFVPVVTVGCGTNSGAYGSSLSCMVSVVRPAGPNTPTGTVAWTTGGAGGFGATTPCTLSSSVPGTATCSATYTPSAVGTGSHLITATYSGDANFVTNYGTQAVTISPKALTMSGLSVASSKVYDGTTSAVVLGTAVLQAHETFAPGTSGDGKPYIGDTVSITGTAIGTYNNKDVGAGTTVTFSGLSLTGGQAGNYTLTLQSPASATITTKALTMSGLSVPASKIYDGTLAAVVNGTAALHSAEATGGAATTSDGKPYIGDTVSLTGTALGTYNSKNVGIATTVTFSGLSLAGGQAGDYSLTIQSPASATIAARPASVTAVDNSKTVGTSDPPLATTNSGFIAGELGVGKITFSATRAAGETVGTYPITPSADDAGSGMLGNYNVALNHGTFTITNELIPTVTVNCGTNTVNLGSSLSCTVSVVRPSGSGTPTGTVAWTTDGAGGFGATTPCTLSSSVSGTASCSATYTPTGVGTGTHMLIATYNGDAVFATNYGSRNVKVTMLYITYLPIILR